MDTKTLINEKILLFLKENKLALLNVGDDKIIIGYEEEPDSYIREILIKFFKKEIIFINVKEKESLKFNLNYDLNFQTDVKDNEEELATNAPIVKLVNEIIEEAIRKKATDIHLEQYKDKVLIKYRIDGILHLVQNLPKNLSVPIVSRIKILSGMNIAEKRLPQDGKFIFNLGNESYDIRVSTLPTIYGESVVLRILKNNKVELILEQLGFYKDHIEILEDLISHPYGLILVTGPTGSGKTTTLYALLNKLNKGDRKIITVEDPVEYDLPGITQVQVNHKIGLTFAKALRTILRQDPDIIMIGEIRDKETAEIAIQAALTGHLVLATLHTNDTASAFTRLMDMGIQEYLLASSVIGVISQRLVRKLCDNCKTKDKTKEFEKRLFLENNVDPPEYLYRASKCEFCLDVGYKGRIAIAEVLKVTEKIRKYVRATSDAYTIKKEAIGEGMRTLLQDGLLKVKDGLTTFEEVLYVAKI